MVAVILVAVVGALGYLLVSSSPGNAPPPFFSSSQSAQSSQAQSASSRSASSATSTSGSKTTQQILHITVNAVPNGGTQRVSYTGVSQIQVSLTAKSQGTAPFTYLWTFGDGTNSSDGVVEHSFPVNRAYDIRLRVTDVTGSVASKEIILDTFSSINTASSVVLYPAQATAGISQIGLEGGSAPPGKPVTVYVDGTFAAATAVDNDGYWSADLSGTFAAKPNGSTYAIGIPALNKTKTLVTLEGISASPVNGVPGGSVLVTGRSYPPDAPVTVYLAGVSLGQVRTDAFGSFQANFSIPSASPLTAAGQYQFSTAPASLGAQATFIVTRSTSALPFVSNGSVVEAAVGVAAVVAVALAALVIFRRRRGGPAPAPEPAPAEESPPPEYSEPPEPPAEPAGSEPLEDA